MGRFGANPAEFFRNKTPCILHDSRKSRAPAEHRRAQRGMPLRLLPPPQKPFCSAWACRVFPERRKKTGAFCARRRSPAPEGGRKRRKRPFRGHKLSAQSIFLLPCFPFSFQPIEYSFPGAWQARGGVRLLTPFPSILHLPDVLFP